MCLNCLPQHEKCLFCINLTDAVIVIFKMHLLLYTPLFILSIIDSKKLGITDFPNISFSRWFNVVTGFWMITSILLGIVLSRCIKHDDARDIILQVYFWLVVATSLIHLVFCLTFVALCVQQCLIPALIHLSTLLIHLMISAYTVIIVNSYRMMLF